MGNLTVHISQESKLLLLVQDLTVCISEHTITCGRMSQLENLI